MKLNPNIFFRFHEGKFIVWNYRAHEQFELTLPYVKRLYEIGTRSSLEIAVPAEPEPVPAQIDPELERGRARLVGASSATPYWGWDTLSHIFHFGTSSQPPSDGALPREDGTAA